MTNETAGTPPDALEDPFKAQKAQKEGFFVTWNPNKVKLAHKWIDEEETLKATGYVRGAVHYCELGRTSEASKTRKDRLLLSPVI